MAKNAKRPTVEAARWRPIKTFRQPDGREVDLWLHITASPRSFGLGDSFRVVEAWRRGGKWFHRDDAKEKELYADYITHWMPVPAPPDEWAAPSKRRASAR